MASKSSCISNNNPLFIPATSIFGYRRTCFGMRSLSLLGFLPKDIIVDQKPCDLRRHWGLFNLALEVRQFCVLHFLQYAYATIIVFVYYEHNICRKIVSNIIYIIIIPQFFANHLLPITIHNLCNISGQQWRHLAC